MLNGFATDLRQSIQSLRKNPAFALTVIVTLSLAIGANSAIFTLADALLFSSLPVAHPERLFKISTVDPKSGRHNLSIPTFQLIQQKANLFENMLAWNGGGVENLELNGQHFAGSVDEVAGDYYSTLGIRPALGRFFTRQDIGLEHFTPARVAVIGYRAWQERYGGDPAVLGKTLLMNGKPFTIIGVHPRSFPGLIREIEADATVPTTAYTSSAEHLYDRTHDYNTVIGRLRSDVTLAKANAQLQTLWPAVRSATTPLTNPERDSFPTRRIQLEPAASGISYLRQRFTRPLYILFGIVSLLLLLACVNLANLASARAQGRAAEYSLRAALGGRPQRLLRASLTESFLLAICGILPGLAVAYGASSYLGQFMWQGLVPLAIPLEPDARIVSFTAAIAGLAAVLFGIVPAWKAAHQDPGAALQLASVRVAGGLGTPGRVMATVQIALSFSILVAALLFSRSLNNVLRSDPGFSPQRLLVAGLFPRITYTGFDKSAYFRHLLEELKAIPGVSAASLSHERPIQLAWKETMGPGNVNGTYHLIAPGFFDTLGMQILRGRDFTLQDDEKHPQVAIISANLATRLFPFKDPVGESMTIGDLKGQFQIVGISSDATLDDPRVRKSPSVYACLFQRPDFLGWSEAIVRTSGDPARFSQSLRKTIERLGREYPLRVSTVADEYEQVLRPERMLSLLTGFFGVVGLLLASIGVYGLLSYTARRRTSEFGIRAALGAGRHDIAMLMFREVAVLLAIGLAPGLLITLFGTRALSALLFGLSAHDPATLVISALLLAAVAILATLLPVIRVTRIDPASALRNE